MDKFTPLSINTVLQNRYRLTTGDNEQDEETRLRGQSGKLSEDHILGIGGQGAVYLALHTKLRKFVAIKQTKVADDAELLRAFEREAQLLSALNHPALPNVSDFFEEDGSYFLVMDLVKGETLLEMMKSKGGKLPFEPVKDIALQLLDVLNYLHKQGIIHKDIKPANLKLTAEGQLKLLDFGLAKGSAGLMTEQKITMLGGSTLAYASPEQDAEMTTTAQSDLYSVAATLYHLASGKIPPHCRIRSQSLASKQPDPLRLVSEIEPQVPLWFAEILHTGLSFPQDERPKSALEFARKISTGKVSAEIPPTIPTKKGEDITYNLKLTAEEATKETWKDITVSRPEPEKISVKIPPNSVSGMTLRIQGKGQRGINAPDGDLLMKLEILPSLIPISEAPDPTDNNSKNEMFSIYNEGIKYQGYAQASLIISVIALLIPIVLLIAARINAPSGPDSIGPLLVIGLFLFISPIISLPLSIISIVFGFVARRKINENPLKHGGDRLALVGIILGFTYIVPIVGLFLFGFIAAIETLTHTNNESNKTANMASAANAANMASNVASNMANMAGNMAKNTAVAESNCQVGDTGSLNTGTNLRSTSYINDANVLSTWDLGGEAKILAITRGQARDKTDNDIWYKVRIISGNCDSNRQPDCRLRYEGYINSDLIDCE